MPRISLRASKLIISAAIPLALIALPASVSTAAPHTTAAKVSVKVVPKTTSSAATLQATVEISHAPAHERGLVDATLYGPVTATSCQSVSAKRFDAAPKKRVLVIAAAGSSRVAVSTPSPKTTGCFAWGATVAFDGVKSTFSPSGSSAIRHSVSATSPALSAPSAVTNEIVTFTTNAANVSWNAPTSDGGSPVTGYTVTATDTTNSANGGQTCNTSGATTCTISNLTTGDVYTFTIVASNSVGSSTTTTPPVTAVSSGTPPTTPGGGGSGGSGGGGGGGAPSATAPGSPTDVVATADVASATITWTAPASDGGSVITGYTATATDTTTSANGGETCTSSSTTCTVTGLTNGDPYTFTVVATNAIGNSTPSAASTSVSPNAVATVPDAPTIVDVIAGNSQAEVEWAAPASDGGSDITGYTITATDTSDSSNGGETCTTVGPTNCIVIALTNGDSYTFTVTATNAVGTSVASSPSSSVIPANVPEDPSDVTATAGGGLASVSWDAPSDDGGSAIVGYTVTATDLTTSANGDETCTTTGALTCTVTGLTNGDSYIFAVQATNVTGTSTPSLPSSAVTPASAPAVPTEVSAAPENASANVTWTPSSSDGGFSITGYTVTATDTTTPANGGETCTTTGAITCTVTGLNNGDSYTFAVTATNDIGTSAHSSPSNAVTPVSAPNAPTDVVATPEDASATVTWSAPDDEGSPITGYIVIADDVTTPVDGGQTCSTTSATTCTVTGLINGDSFTFTVRATNAVDPSPFSTASNAVTPATEPDAPTDVTASPEGNAAIVTWTASASDGGSAITNYLVTATDTTNSANGGETCTTEDATTCTVSGLNAGDTYTFSVQAINGVGDSAASSPTGGEVVPEENSVVDSISVIPEAENVWTNPAGTYGYVTGVTGNTIDVVNLATDTVTETMTVGSASPGQGPDDMVFNSAGTYAYVASEAGVVAVVNLTTNTVIDNIDIANQPNSISIITGGQYAWVFGQGSGVVSIVDLATNTVTGTFTAVEGLSDPVFNDAGTFGYLADFNTGQVYVVNVATDAVTTLTVGSDPEITANPAGTLAYVENYGSDTISVINLSTNTVTATITVGTSPNSVTFNSAGTYAYVTNSASNTVSVIDVATATVVATINVGTQPEDFNFNNAGTYAYVIDSGSNTVSVIDLATDTVTGTVNIGSDSNGMWMSSDGEWGYVSNMGSNTVTAINLTTNTPTTINVGTEPANYAVNGSGTYLYVANMGSGTLSVIAIG